MGTPVTARAHREPSCQGLNKWQTLIVVTLFTLAHTSTLPYAGEGAEAPEAEGRACRRVHRTERGGRASGRRRAASHTQGVNQGVGMRGVVVQ